MFSINDKQKQIRFKMIQMTFVNCISIIPNNFHNVIVPFLFDFDDDLNRFFPNEYESESVAISTIKNDEWRNIDSSEREKTNEIRIVNKQFSMNIIVWNLLILLNELMIRIKIVLKKKNVIMMNV